jgi:hypothetical protein
MGHSGDTTKTGAPARDAFAPPPEGAADRPWQPRGPVAHAGLHESSGSGGAGTGPGSSRPQDARPGSGEAGGPGSSSGSGTGTGTGGGTTSPRPEGDAGDGSDTAGDPGTPSRGRAQVPPPHPWSPGYQGQQPPLPRFPYQPSGPRYDPNDPVLRRSRLALLCGIWGFFFMVLGVPYLTLLLGALALYWGVSALRGEVKPSPAAKTAALTGVQPMPQSSPYYPAPSTRPQVPAALGGLVAGAVSLALVGAVFGVQLYYKSYYDCQANALTKTAYDACATSVSPRPPAWLTQFNGN